VSNNRTVVPAQPGFARVMPWTHNERGNADARLFEYTPIIAWRIALHSDDDVTVHGIDVTGATCDDYLLRPDGRIDHLEDGYTLPNAEALAKVVNEYWEKLRLEREAT